MSKKNKDKQDMTQSVAPSGGSRPIMRSVNILITHKMDQYLSDMNFRSRSAAVRDIVTIILRAYDANNIWIIDTLKKLIVKSAPLQRREDAKNDMVWVKAIIWIPENMYREIDCITAPNQIKVSEFLRGTVIFAMLPT